ncbi:hypothetical protein C8A01DRAFT_36631 [Parachaetomium inaequale]|uniref:GIT Spa2 homology (SHD) domain-containing protein n=1 Tax=Parachaetomium inaequale TaxID=2588326 RepID=A0AAN6PHS2_9PEZI|nr:hypothetical protein C8A01DRAFT_36631 [Parachaetomium inaequale]
MHLVPAPLPTTLDDLLASATRVSALVQPAFGLATDSQQGSGDNNTNNNNDNTIEDRGSSSSTREERGQKRVVRVRYDLNHARSLLLQLQSILLDRDKWEGIHYQRKRLVELRELAAALGAGAMVFSCLEDALRGLGRLYEMEGRIKRRRGKGKGKEGHCKDIEKDVDVVRWMRHERRGEVWDMMKGVKDLGTAVWFVLTILESPSDDDAATSRANLQAAVAAILGKDNELSRDVRELYPDLNSRLSRLETDMASTDGGSSLGQNTPRSSTLSTDTLVFRTATPSDKLVIVCDVDDSDSDSEGGPPTPSSSEFPFPDADMDPEGYQATLALMTNPSVVRVPVPASTNRSMPGPDMDILPLSNTTNSSSDDTDEPTPTHRASRPLKVITVSTSGVDISPLPSDLDTSSLPQPTPDTALSADAVFQLPEVTDQIVLDFFRRALRVSRFAAQFADDSRLSKRPPPPAGCDDHNHMTHLSSQRQKLENLRPRQLRELCTDLYDELVRRNVEDQNRGRGRGGGGADSERVRFVEPEGFNVKRVYARGRLAGMGDAHLVRSIAVVLGELERRCENRPYASRRVECKAAAELGLETISAGSGDRWSVEAVWGARIW